MKIGVHGKDISKGHIGLGRYVTDTSRLFVQLAMKKIGINEELLPKGFLEKMKLMKRVTPQLGSTVILLELPCH